MNSANDRKKRFPTACSAALVGVEHAFVGGGGTRRGCEGEHLGGFLALAVEQIGFCPQPAASKAFYLDLAKRRRVLAPFRYRRLADTKCGSQALLRPVVGNCLVCSHVR
jgi:hypothetical protein